MAKVHMLVHIDFTNLDLRMACGRMAGPYNDAGEPLLYTNSEDLLHKIGGTACDGCVAHMQSLAAKNGGD